MDRVATGWQEVKEPWEPWRSCCLWTSNCTKSELERVVTGWQEVKEPWKLLKVLLVRNLSNWTESELDNVVTGRQEVKEPLQLWKSCWLEASTCTESELDVLSPGCKKWGNHDIYEGTESELDNVVPRWETVKEPWQLWRSCWLGGTSNCTESELNSGVPRW